MSLVSLERLCDSLKGHKIDLSEYHYYGKRAMDSKLKTLVWNQFGAAIDMLEEGINACPEELWTAVLWDDAEDPRFGHFWFIAYHSLFWLDLYLGGTSEGFKPPAPFIRGALPEKPYSKGDISAYLEHCRQKCQSVFEGLTDEKASQICKFEWMEPSFLELQLYNMRHVQEHSSQLRYFLGRKGIATNDWVAKVGAGKS
jgi:hypothetical protein